jgi:molecular chaperone DnaK
MERKKMSKVIGIDLGTTNSCMAVVEGGKPVVITNAEGERTTPSVVAFTKDGERLVGGAAKRQLATNPARTVSSIKRQMGSDYRVRIDGKTLTPQEISSMILAKLRRDAESFTGEPVTDAVITVPAYFDDSQRKATQDAGRIAGLNVLRIINEPTAAAVAYGLDNEAAQKILVYDLGGGTFDVSIIEIEDGTFTVLATGGDTQLGGDDFDACIVDWLVREFEKSDRIDLRRDPAAMGRLKEEAEKAKKELSAAASVQINLPFLAVDKAGPHHMDVTLTRAAFEMMTGELLNRTVAPVQNALRDAGISARELGKVLLVGGSTRMPAVERKVRETLGVEPSKTLNPDECVAMGAAVQGGLLQGGGRLIGAKGQASKGLVLMDVTPLTLSIETLGGVATPLIERNSMIPTRKSQIFTTAHALQTAVEINVLQGERHFARDNKSLGKFKLGGIHSGFVDKPQIEVTFDIDVNGVVKVSAKDLATGRQQEITITGSTNLSENEVQRAMADAAAYAQEDTLRKERMELHNQAEMLSYSVDEALAKCKKQLEKPETEAIRADLAALRKCIRKDKPEKMAESEAQALRAAKEKLEASASHLMILYTEQQQAAQDAQNEQNPPSGGDEPHKPL